MFNTTIFPQDSSFFGERPELKFTGALASLTDIDKTHIRKIVFDSKTINENVHGYVYLTVFGLAMVSLILLEIEKLIKLKFHEIKKIDDNSQFKLIPKPITSYETQWLLLMMKTLNQKNLKLMKIILLVKLKT